MGISYKDSGVDIAKADSLVKAISGMAKTTNRKGMVSGIGGFGGLFALDIKKYPKPILISSTDGVGTKLKLAFMAKKYDGLGHDLVAMCVNDILVYGAEPLFFLDYFATGKLNLAIGKKVLASIADACKVAKVALIGGETAEMPGFYAAGEFDLAGFIVGVVNQGSEIDGSKITKGDTVISIASSGVHSNGFSLVRKIIFEKQRLKVDSRIKDLGKTVADAFLVPTKIYTSFIEKAKAKSTIHGMVHITGGGFWENIPRVVPEKFTTVIERKSLDILPVFEWLAKAGGVGEYEMFRTFNMGTGLIVVCPPKDAAKILAAAKASGESARVIGEIVPKRKKAVELV